MSQRGINKVTLIGNLGADPEVKQFEGGELAKIRVATSRTYKNKKGEKVEATEWHRITCFNSTAKFVGTYLTKGRKVYVEGRLETSKYQDKEGNDRFSTEIIATEVQALDSNPTVSSPGS